MPTIPDAPGEIGPDDLRVLLAMAGLDIPAARAPQVLRELNAQLALAGTLDPILAGAPPPAFAPYDPAFPAVKLDDEDGGTA